MKKQKRFLFPILIIGVVFLVFIAIFFSFNKNFLISSFLSGRGLANLNQAITQTITFTNRQIYNDANSKVSSLPCVNHRCNGTFGFCTSACAGGYYPDNLTAQKICQEKGYDTVSSFTTQKNFYSSCNDNFMWQWNGKTVQYVWACTKNIGIDTVTCTKKVCTPNWACAAWNACANGQQTRTCTDSNNCGTTNYQPTLAQSCTTCVPNWTCGAWTTCAANGQQTRACSDSNNCSTTINKPALTQSCTTCVPNWQCTSWNTCTNGQQTRNCTDLNNCGAATGQPSLTQSCSNAVSNGLIVIKKGVDGQDFAEQVAKSRGWKFLAVSTSDYQQIKNQIVSIYKQQNFKYLLLIGTNEEIPYAVYDSSKNLYKTDPSLYADINGDGFAEIAVGRLPFSSQAELSKYFTDLSPKGNSISLEYFPFSASRQDPDDEYVVKGFSYAKCLSSFYPTIQEYSNDDILDLIKHYKQSAVVDLSTHGADSYAAVDGQFNNLSINSFCANFKKRTSLDDPFTQCQNPEYLSNRPVIIHMSCNNGKQLGVDLIKNGASAFLGFYNPSGGAPTPIQYILSGDTVGEALQKMYNSKILANAEAKTQNGYFSLLSNTGVINTFDILNRNQIKEIPFDDYGFILYGDPSLKLPNTFSKLTGNTTVGQTSGRITITAKSPSIFDISQQENLLCYAGNSVAEPSFVYKNSWANDHDVMFSFPVSGVNQLLTAKAIIGSDSFTLDASKFDYNITLLKGVSQEYVFVRLRGFTPLYTSFDYTKNLQILIDYN